MTDKEDKWIIEALTTNVRDLTMELEIYKQSIREADVKINELKKDVDYHIMVNEVLREKTWILEDDNKKLKESYKKLTEREKCDHRELWRNYVLDQPNSNIQSKVDVCRECNRILFEKE